MKQLFSAIAIASILATPAANAEFVFKPENLYGGGGLGYTTFDALGAGNAIGYQFFGGYNLGIKLVDHGEKSQTLSP